MGSCVVPFCSALPCAMKLIDQVDLLISFDALQSPDFDSNDWWTEGSMCSESERPPPEVLDVYVNSVDEITNRTFSSQQVTDYIAFGEDTTVDTWKASICATDEDLKSRAFTVMMGCFAVVLTLSTCQLYVVKGMLGDEEKGFSDFDVVNVPWPLYFKTFFGPYLITFAVSAWLALIVLWYPCCYDAGTFCIGFCFTLALVLTYIIPYLDTSFIESLKNMNESENRIQKEVAREELCIWGILQQEEEKSIQEALDKAKKQLGESRETRQAVFNKADLYYNSEFKDMKGFKIGAASFKQLIKMRDEVLQKKQDKAKGATLGEAIKDVGKEGVTGFFSPRHVDQRLQQTLSMSNISRVSSQNALDALNATKPAMKKRSSLTRMPSSQGLRRRLSKNNVSSNASQKEP